MRVLNESRSVAVTTVGDGIVEAGVRVRGFQSRVGGSGFGYERHTPAALIVRGDGGERTRTRLHHDGVNWAAFAAPLAVYLVTRTTLGRRRRAR